MRLGHFAAIAAGGKTVYAINASQEPSLVLDLSEAPADVEAFDTFGKSVGFRKLAKGLQRVAVPLSGFLVIRPRVEWPLETLYKTPRVFPADAYKTNGIEVAFLENSPMWEKPLKQMGAEKTAEWKAIWDPIRYLAHAKIPVHWLAGTNDRAFSLPSLMDSYAVVSTEKSLAVKVRLVHTHGKPSEEATELTTWADHHLCGVPLPRPVKAELNFTKDFTAAWIDRKWETLPAKLADGKAVADIPDDAMAWYFNTYSGDGFIDSTPIRISK